MNENQPPLLRKIQESTYGTQFTVTKTLSEESNLRIFSNQWRQEIIDGKPMCYLGEYRCGIINDAYEFVPDGRGFKVSQAENGIADQSSLYVGRFENGYLNGYAWEITAKSDENANSALDDWSFESVVDDDISFENIKIV